MASQQAQQQISGAAEMGSLVPFKSVKKWQTDRPTGPRKHSPGAHRHSGGLRDQMIHVVPWWSLRCVRWRDAALAACCRFFEESMEKGREGSHDLVDTTFWMLGLHFSNACFREPFSRIQESFLRGSYSRMLTGRL